MTDIVIGIDSRPAERGASRLQLAIARLGRGFRTLDDQVSVFDRKLNILQRAWRGIRNAMRRVVQSLGNLGAAFRRMSARLVMAARNLKKVTREAFQAGRSVDLLGKAAGGKIAASIAFATAVFGIKRLFTLGTEAEETRSKLLSVFGDAGRAAKSFAADLGTIAGLGGRGTEELLATAGAVAQGLGVAQEASFNFAQQIIQTAADLSSFNNIQTEQSARAIISALTGEREALKTLGIVIKSTDVEARAALDTKTANIKELTQEQLAYATLALVQEKAGVAIGDLARTQQSAATKLNNLVLE